MPTPMIELLSTSPEQTQGLAAAIAALARPSDLIVLAGEMGAGKTAFAQGFARQLGIHEPVTSPTYTLVRTYQAGRLSLHHVDLYRLEHTAEIDDLALSELLDDRSIMLVEWGDVVDLGPQLHVELRVGSDVEAREITLTSSDRRWLPRWERLEAALQEWVAA